MRWKSPTPGSTRRSVYGYIDRQNLPDLFRAFDFASPDTTSARRFYTTVPQQALFLMNSPFVIEQAKKSGQPPGFSRPRNTDERTLAPALRTRISARTHRRRNRARAPIHCTGRSPRLHPPARPIGCLVTAASTRKTKRVKNFHKLPFFDGRAFQGGPALPDPEAGLGRGERRLAAIRKRPETCGHPALDRAARREHLHQGRLSNTDPRRRRRARTHCFQPTRACSANGSCMTRKHDASVERCQRQAGRHN